jgi:hypothetical protein
MLNLFLRCVLIILIWYFATGVPILYAQGRSFPVDSLTTVIDGNYPPYNQVRPGDTLLLEYGKRNYILLRNFQGEADNPIVIINSGGVVSINTDHYYGISIRNCRYLKLTGTGDQNHFYGFKIERVANGGGIGIGERSSDFEIDHVSVENCRGVGISAKTDPDCSFTNDRDKFTQFNSVLHDNYIAEVSYEGMYIGSTKYFGQTVNCDGRDTLLLPSLLDGVRIYNNIIKYSGWDGIQVSSASSNCQVFDNLIMFDSQAEFANQMSGILLGGGSKCDCYNNYISQGKGNGIENHGMGGNRIFNNIIVDAGRSFQPLDSSKMRHGIFVSDVSMQVDSSVYILHNNIINPKSDGIRFSSLKSRHNLIASNLIINPGNFDYYENGNTSFTGADSYIMLTNHTIDAALKNNYFSRNADDAGFSSSDYTLFPDSPLIDSAYYDNKGVVLDYYHHPRPVGIASDIGAVEFKPEYLNMPSGSTNLGVRPLLFPDPVKTWLCIQYQNIDQVRTSLDIYNLQGNRVISGDYPFLPGSIQVINVNVTFLPPGIYIYRLSSGLQKVSGKFNKVN